MISVKHCGMSGHMTVRHDILHHTKPQRFKAYSPIWDNTITCMTHTTLCHLTQHNITPCPYTLLRQHTALRTMPRYCMMHDAVQYHIKKENGPIFFSRCYENININRYNPYKLLEEFKSTEERTPWAWFHGPSEKPIFLMGKQKAQLTIQMPFNPSFLEGSLTNTSYSEMDSRARPAPWQHEQWKSRPWRKLTIDLQ